MSKDREDLRSLVIIILREFFLYKTFDESHLSPSFYELNIPTSWLSALCSLYKVYESIDYDF